MILVLSVRHLLPLLSEFCVSASLREMLFCDGTLAYIGPGAGITFLGSFFILFAALGLLLLSILTWPIRFAMLWFKRRRFRRFPHPQWPLEEGLARALHLFLDFHRLRRASLGGGRQYGCLMATYGP